MRCRCRAHRDPAAQQRLDELATRLVRAADLVANLVRSAVRAGLFSPGATVKLDADILSSVRENLWEQTEVPFFDALERAARRGVTVAEPGAWQVLLRHTALALFDEAAPLSPFSGNAAPRHRARAPQPALCPHRLWQGWRCAIRDARPPGSGV